MAMPYSLPLLYPHFQNIFRKNLQDFFDCFPSEVQISTEIKNGIKIRPQTAVTLEKSEGMLSAVKAKSGTFPENHISTTIKNIFNMMFHFTS